MPNQFQMLELLTFYDVTSSYKRFLQDTEYDYVQLQNHKPYTFQSLLLMKHAIVHDNQSLLHLNDECKDACLFFEHLPYNE
jgi:hypothetical protein